MSGFRDVFLRATPPEKYSIQHNIIILSRYSAMQAYIWTLDNRQYLMHFGQCILAYYPMEINAK